MIGGRPVFSLGLDFPIQAVQGVCFAFLPPSPPLPVAPAFLKKVSLWAIASKKGHQAAQKKVLQLYLLLLRKLLLSLLPKGKGSVCGRHLA